MSKNRMSIEELNALKPSFENPVELVCDDGHFKNFFSKVKIISPEHNGQFVLIDGDNELNIFLTKEITHYPSKKQEPRIEILYETYGDYGETRLVDSNGSYPIFSDKRFNGLKNTSCLTRKTGITRKLNLDTFELVEE